MGAGIRHWQGPLMVALFALPLAGCSQFGSTLAGRTLQDALGDGEATHRERARELPFASLVAEMEGNRSLLVLAYHNGEAGGDTTLWQARDRATLTLDQGWPASTAGFTSNLLSLNYASPPQEGSHYRVRAHWEDAEGFDHLAIGQATLACHAPAPLELPLIELELERCDERVEWQDAGTSHNTLWRHPVSKRIWAGELEPWPDAQTIEWQVARPWWES